LHSQQTDGPPAFNFKPPQNSKVLAQKKDDDSESDYSISDWDASDDEDASPGEQARPGELPNPLKIGGGKPIPPPGSKSAIPDVLKAGPPPGVAIKKSLEQISPEPTGSTAASWGGVSNSSGSSVPLQTNNPYLRMQTTGQSNFGGESSQQVWGDAPSQDRNDAPSHARKYSDLVELPAFNTPDTPTNPMANLKLDSNVPPQPSRKSPDQPPLIAVESPSPHPQSPRHDSTASEAFEPGMDISSIDAFARNYGLPENQHPETPQRTWQEQQDWEKSERERRQREMAAASEAAMRAEQERKHEEEFHRMEQANAQPQPHYFTPDSSPDQEASAPPLPVRTQNLMDDVFEPPNHPPPMPPRPANIDTSNSPQPGVVESPTTVRRKEHYQIKHIRWYDANIRQVRQSPVLTQNINGPCPLLALVNALVLSTPANLKTEFVETLRTREQVSLGLLLDALFEELMSGRRGDAAQELPDVNELYKFLLGLQTGLNVNPMFVQDPDATDGTSNLTSSFATHAGGFETTKDMRLYRTFNVPMFHGWLPEPGSDAYIAFDRVAKTYETSQYIQFQEEELDAKLNAEGLNNDEQRLFTDIHAIKEFLNLWPTQLTDSGLRAMQQTIKPGQVGILFRNDHFSTLYKNPHTGELMTLVTDQGYATHDEIVWESLVDVNGQGSELYSGDFRAVGNNSNPQRQQAQQQRPVQSLLDVDGDQGWTTVTNNRRNNDTPLTALAPINTNAASTSNPDLNATYVFGTISITLTMPEGSRRAIWVCGAI
jgi:ubiquitin carboxyl-terminal hydrolase MINDY-1/2